jgi:hypothetical protein
MTRARDIANIINTAPSIYATDSEVAATYLTTASATSSYAALTGATFSGNINMSAGIFSPFNIKEKWNIVASAISGTMNVDFITAQNWLYTTASTGGATTINFRASSGTTLSSLIPVGESITYVVAATTGASTPGYFSTVQVDGTVTGVTTRWLGSVAPTGGDASAVNAYIFTIVKTASTPTYTIFASVAKY